MIRLALASLLLLVPLEVGAQAPPARAADTLPAPSRIGPRRALDGAVTPPQVALSSPALATSASLILPGMGQLLMGKRRWAVYAGIELAGWIVHLDRLRAGRRLRQSYRDVAWAVARGMPEPRREGNWEYYETMGAWLRSGSWDADEARDGLQPESDPAT